jgi:pilus assembly protein CpaB
VSPRTIILGVLALTFGGSAAVGVNLFFRQDADRPPTDSVPVVVARTDIPRGAMVTAEQVKLQNFPKDHVPPGAITDIKDAVERVAFSFVVKEEPLLDRKLSAKHSKGGLAPLVPKGMRAFTIQTPNVTTQLAGFLLPGNKVDVLLTMSAGGPNDRTGGGVTTTLLQNVEILAVDQRLDVPTENKVDTRNLQSVTLLVTPDQAAKLDLGQNKGTLHLSLRNPEDEDAAKTRPATLSGLQFHQEAPWGTQIAQIVEAFGKLKTAPSPEAAKPSSRAEAGPPPALEIRTLRGSHFGVVQLEPVVPADSDH